MLSQPRQHGLPSLFPNLFPTRHPAKSLMQNASSKPTEPSGMPVPTKGMKVHAKSEKPRLVSSTTSQYPYINDLFTTCRRRRRKQTRRSKIPLPWFLLLQYALYTSQNLGAIQLGMLTYAYAMIMSVSSAAVRD
jgi:hypothetical protein